MKEFWSKIGNNITQFLLWAVDNHFGKLAGTALGLLCGLLFVVLGLWRTFVLFLFICAGFYLGKRQDEFQDITAWLKKLRR